MKKTPPVNIESKGETSVASGGSEFRLSSRDSGTTIGLMKGDVHSIGGWTIEISPQVAELLGSVPSVKAKLPSRKYYILPIESGYQTSVRAMNACELKFRVTDERSQPAPGLPVTFSLNTFDGKSVGVLGYGQIVANRLTVVTDAQGVATVPFRAGNEPGSVAISATVEGDTQSQTRLVTVTSDKGFWNKKTAIPVFATAAAMIVAGIVVVATNGDRLPIRGTGPIEIIP